MEYVGKRVGRVGGRGRRAADLARRFVQRLKEKRNVIQVSIF